MIFHDWSDLLKYKIVIYYICVIVNNSHEKTRDNTTMEVCVTEERAILGYKGS